MISTDEKPIKMSDHLMNLSDLLRHDKAEEAKRLLMKVSGLLDARDDAGRGTPHYAAVGGCLPILQFSIGQNKDVAHQKDDMGWTVLIIASSAGRTEIVRYLLSLPEIDINGRTSNGQSALHYAASKNHREICHLLLEAGADINVCDKYGATPLHRAASQGHYQIVKMFVNHPKIHLDARNSEGNTALFLACEENREDSAITLVQKGANLSLKNKEEKSPLDICQSYELKTKLKTAESRFH